MSTPPIRPVGPTPGAIPPVTPVVRRRKEEHEREQREEQRRRQQQDEQQPVRPVDDDPSDGHIDVIA